MSLFRCRFPYLLLLNMCCASRQCPCQDLSLKKDHGFLFAVCQLQSTGHQLWWLGRLPSEARRTKHHVQSSLWTKALKPCQAYAELTTALHIINWGMH
jgi:hypothetical protein